MKPSNSNHKLLTVARHDGHLPIEQYGVIGDGRTAALVAADGAIDWMCLPEIDSPSVFAALLDRNHGGHFTITPAVPFKTRRRYQECTNVLVTEFQTAQGSVQLTDAVTLDSGLNAPWRELARELRGISGTVPMRVHCEPRFGFGQRAAQWSEQETSFITGDGELQMRLCAWGQAKFRARDGAVSAELTVGEGETVLTTLIAVSGRTLPAPDRVSVQRRLGQTGDVWQAWLSRHNYEGRWRDAVERSLLALALLADGRTGAVAAAATSSLPEAIGGERNYDYRFAWVRDLSFTVEAMLLVGMQEFAHRSIGWILDAVSRTAPRIDPVYTLTGEVLRDQQRLPLAGWRGTSPVNLGNQAGTQLQLGGAGDLIETIWQAVCRGSLLPDRVGEQMADVIDQLCMTWRTPDAGFWELNDYAHYTTSKLSCWVAFDRGLQMAERGALPDRHLERWRDHRDQLRNYIESELWSEARGSYLMKAGSDDLDCGVLLAARRGYLPRGSERLNRTIDAIIGELDAGDGLLYRYSGMREQENAFLACSFWMVEALAHVGRIDEAHERMHQLIPLASDLGLYSEEMEPRSKAMRGNFPQALTHLAVINAARMLHELS